MLLRGDDYRISIPEVAKAMPGAIRSGDALPQLLASSLRAVADDVTYHLASRATRARPKPIVCWLFSAQMTTVHPIRARSPLRRLVAAQLASRPTQAMSAFFFEPSGDALSGDAEGARQTAQTAAFVISTKDALTFLLGVAVGLRVVTAAASAVSTEVALFAILREAIARKFIAAAVIAC